MGKDRRQEIIEALEGLASTSTDVATELRQLGRDIANHNQAFRNQMSHMFLPEGTFEKQADELDSLASRAKQAADAAGRQVLEVRRPKPQKVDNLAKDIGGLNMLAFRYFKAEQNHAAAMHMLPETADASRRAMLDYHHQRERVFRGSRKFVAELSTNRL